MTQRLPRTIRRRDRARHDFVVVVDRIHTAHPLQLSNRTLRHQEDAALLAGLDVDAAEGARQQGEVRGGEIKGDFQGARLWVDGAICRPETTRVAVGVAIRQQELKGRSAARLPRSASSRAFWM